MPDVIELTSKTRLVIGQEPNPQSPRIEGECITGTYTPPSWWGHPTEGPSPLYDHPGNIVEADDKLAPLMEDEPYAAVSRWSRANYGVEVVRLGETYWYCDRHMFDELHGGEFTSEVQRAVIAAEAEAYQAYLRGDARFIAFQRLAHFRRTTKKYHEKQEDLLRVWEEIDTLRDVYLDEGYSVADAANEYFFSLMNQRERAVLTAMLDSEATERALPGS